MSTPIEDYAIIGDTKTVAAVARNGSIDWWCVPRIDSGAVFAALVGEPEHGRWLIAPKHEVSSIRRRYAGDSLVLETEYGTADGTVKVTDFMSPGLQHPTIFRLVEGQSGAVPMQLELIARFDYGSVVPWAQATGDGLTLVAANDALRFHSPVPLHDRDQTTTADFTVHEGSAAASRSRTTRRSRIRRHRWTRRPRSAAPCSTGRSGWSGARTRESGETRSCAR